MEHRDKTFQGEDVWVCGNTFTSCTFKNCRMLYDGTAQLLMSACHFYNSPWVVDGPAMRTLDFLTAMYAGGFGDSGKRMVEATFENIRKGIRPTQDDSAHG
jgi:hypothetical protein